MPVSVVGAAAAAVEAKWFWYECRDGLSPLASGDSRTPRECECWTASVLDCVRWRPHALGHNLALKYALGANVPWRSRMRSPAPMGSPSGLSFASGGEDGRSGVVAIERRKSSSALLDCCGPACGAPGELAGTRTRVGRMAATDAPANDLWAVDASY
jgi:hypothetical protein